VAGELGGGERLGLGEKLDQLLGARARVNGAGEVELDAVAGGEQDQFAVGETLLEKIESFGALLGVEGQALAQFERGGGVVQSQEQEAVHQKIAGVDFENFKFEISDFRI